MLAAVQARPTHGYAIAETLRARSDGAFDLPEGTLYPALHRLERGGLLSSRWSEVNGRRRRVYQLTRAGHRALAKRQRRVAATSPGRFTQWWRVPRDISARGVFEQA
jgi:PadR family transcriptional regulator, regulatory protein PadR